MGTTDDFDNVQFYDFRRRGIQFQEELFGQTFVHAGGQNLTTRICKNNALAVGQKVCELFKV